MVGPVAVLTFSILLALFFIGPALLARQAMERRLRQPTRAQTSTEELARYIFFSSFFVVIAALATWASITFLPTKYAFNLDALNPLFADGSSLQTRWWDSTWVIRWMMAWLYLLDFAYIGLLYLAIPLFGRLNGIWRDLCAFLLAPYLRSDWDVLAAKIGFLPNTEIQADVEVKGGKIFMGKLEKLQTSSDGGLLYLQLLTPAIRARNAPTVFPLAVQVGTHTGTVQSGQTIAPNYVFKESSRFVILASDISNINFRIKGVTDAVPPTKLAQDIAPADLKSLRDRIKNVEAKAEQPVSPDGKI
jgi:hypothetical protein